LIIYNYLNADPGEDRLDVAAQELQDFVLPNEWIMLPATVQMAARLIVENKLETHNSPCFIRRTDYDDGAGIMSVGNVNGRYADGSQKNN
jgi:hypothetical protein